MDHTLHKRDHRRDRVPWYCLATALQDEDDVVLALPLRVDRVLTISHDISLSISVLNGSQEGALPRWQDLPTS